MKKSLLQVLSFTAFFLLLFSCQKEENATILPSQKEEISAKDYIERHIDQNILFQYSEIDEQGELKNGWVIDRNGQVMGFSFESRNWDETDQTCTIDEMAQLENALSTTLGQVDLDELVSHYKLISRAAHSNPVINYNVGQASYAFLIYRLQKTDYQRNISPHSCGGGNEDPVFSSPYYDQVVLHQEGSVDIRTGTSQAKAIVAWLKKIQIEFDR